MLGCNTALSALIPDQTIKQTSKHVSFLFISDQKTHSKSHQTTHECFHGMESTGTKKNNRKDTRQA